ncbi:MAG: hypothetical protein ACLSWV_01230 [Pygmaiobacter massiliensis]
MHELGIVFHITASRRLGAEAAPISTVTLEMGRSPSLILIWRIAGGGRQPFELLRGAPCGSRTIPAVTLCEAAAKHTAPWSMVKPALLCR